MHSTCPDHPQFSCQRPFAAMVSASVDGVSQRAGLGPGRPSFRRQPVRPLRGQMRTGHAEPLCRQEPVRREKSLCSEESLCRQMRAQSLCGEKSLRGQEPLRRQSVCRQAQPLRR